MAMDLLEFLTKGLGSDFASKAAGLLGESTQGTQSALDAALPLLLAGAARKAATPDGASDLLGLINRHGTDPAQLTNIGSLLSGGNLGSLTSAGSGILSGLFGDRTNGLWGALASLAGIRPGSATTLLSALAPLAFGLLRGHASREGLGASGLSNLLLGQRDTLARRVPDGLSRSLGWGAPATWYAGAREPVVEEKPSFLRRWLPWIIAAAVALWLLSMLTKCGREAEVTQAPVVAPVVEPVAAPAATPAPAKLYFDVGSAVAPVDSAAQLDAIAAYAKANPGTRLAVSGYHDPSGDSAVNDALAKSRAEAARNVLVGLGVPETSIELDKPIITTGGGEERESRRVEVAVR